MFLGASIDVFPGIPIEEIEYKELKEAIRLSLSELKFEVVPSQIAKILQLYEALRQRMGTEPRQIHDTGQREPLEHQKHATCT